MWATTPGEHFISRHTHWTDQSLLVIWRLYKSPGSPGSFDQKNQEKTVVGNQKIRKMEWETERINPSKFLFSSTLQSYSICRLALYTNIRKLSISMTVLNAGNWGKHFQYCYFPLVQSSSTFQWQISPFPLAYVYAYVLYYHFPLYVYPPYLVLCSY